MGFQQRGMCDQQSLISACAYAQSDQSLCQSLEYPMSVKPLTDYHLEFLSLKGGCTGWSESTLVKMPLCWKSRVTAYFYCRKIVTCWGNEVHVLNLFQDFITALRISTKS